MKVLKARNLSIRVASGVAFAAFAAGFVFFSALPLEANGRQAHALPALTMQEDAFAAAVEYRRNNGLQHDEEFVRGIEANSDSRREFGPALTDDEFIEISGRQERIVAVAERLNEALSEDPGFAGVYVDQRAGFVMEVSTTSDPAVLDKTVESFAAEGIRLRVSRAEWTLDELSHLRDDIAAEIPVWTAGGIDIGLVKVDVRTNRVVVSVVTPSGDDGSRLRAAYGDRIEIVGLDDFPSHTACVNRLTCASPVKAGLGIQDAYGTTCSSGFVSRDQPYPGAWYLLTAGHCINVNGIGVSWLHNGSTIGTASSIFYYNGASLDIGYILLSSAASPGNQFYAASNSDLRSLTSVYGNGAQYVGLSLCRGARTTNYVCGLIQDQYVAVNYGGVVIYNLWQTNFTSTGGDSGGPYFLNYGGLGVHSGTIGACNLSLYTPLGTVLSTTGKQPCLVSAC